MYYSNGLFGVPTLIQSYFKTWLKHVFLSEHWCNLKNQTIKDQEWDFILKDPKYYNAFNSAKNSVLKTELHNNTTNDDSKNPKIAGVAKFSKIRELQNKFKQANRINDESIKKVIPNVKQEIEVSVIMTETDYRHESEAANRGDDDCLSENIETPIICMYCKGEGTKENPICVILAFINLIRIKSLSPIINTVCTWLSVDLEDRPKP